MDCRWQTPEVGPTPTQQDAMASTKMCVTVPDGLWAGDAMTVAVGNSQFTITVPEGLQGGDLLEVDLPADSPEESPSTVIVAVPDGCFAGHEFTVDFDGQQFNITVPDGCQPGDEIEVEVPREVPHQKQPLGQLPEEPQQQHEAPEELVRQRAMVCGLITNGVLNRRKGTIVSYDAETGLFKLAIDKMFPYVSIRRENIVPLPWEEEPDTSNDEEPLEAPRAGVYYVGDRVLVERSNGSTSLAIIAEYDEVFETFTVDVGHGMLKYGVEESYITPHETTTEWVGPAARVNGTWEGFFVGRRVRIRIPFRRSDDDDDDDRNGAVVGYDDRTERYHVELDSGVLRRDVPYRDIKVIYQMRNGVMA